MREHTYTHTHALVHLCACGGLRCRFSYLLEACLDLNRSVLMTGMTGVGKSVIMVAALEELRERKGVVPFTLNFSAQTRAVDAQMLMESKLEKKRKTRCRHACVWMCVGVCDFVCVFTYSRMAVYVFANRGWLMGALV